MKWKLTLLGEVKIGIIVYEGIQASDRIGENQNNIYWMP